MHRVLIGVVVVCAACAAVFTAAWSSTTGVLSASIPEGVVLIWPGTNGTIPAGFTRETLLDGLYPRSAPAGSDPNVTGGSNTHSHSSPSHEHSMNSHGHNVVLGWSNESGGNSDPGGPGEPRHEHTSAAISSTSGGTLSGNAVTWSGTSSEPPYAEVIFIKPASGPAALPSGVAAHYNGASEPSGWYFCNSANGTPDLRNRYLKGAATGGNSGGAGGTTSHQHAVTHGHTAGNHSHSGTSTWSSTPHGDRQSFSCCRNELIRDHYHAITLENNPPGANDYTKTDAGSGDMVEPAYRKLGAIQSGGGQLPTGLVAMWLGGISSIPSGWVLCNGTNGTLDLRDKFLKIGSGLANNGETGGSNTHQHSSITHGHTATGSHSHSLTVGLGSHTGERNGGGGNGWAPWDHYHTGNSVSDGTASYADSSLGCNASDNQPAFRTVVYIQYNNSPPTSFSLSAPPDGTQTNDNTPSFGWGTSTDPEGLAISYTLKLSADALFTEPVYRTVSGMSSTSYTPPGGQEIGDGSYYWKVIASDGALETESAGTRGITVDTQNPATPTIGSMSPDFATGKITKMYGAGENGTTLVVYDQDGNPIAGSTQWDGSGNFTFTPSTPLDSGSAMYVVTEDGATNTSRSDTGVASFSYVRNVFPDDAVDHGSGGSSVRMERDTRYTFDLAANAGAPVTVKAWLMKNAAYSGTAPKVTLTGPGIDGSGAATASMTVGADVWEEVTVSGTPDASGVLTLTVETFATVAGAKTWVDDIAASQE